MKYIRFQLQVITGQQWGRNLKIRQPATDKESCDSSCSSFCGRAAFVSFENLCVTSMIN